MASRQSNDFFAPVFRKALLTAVITVLMDFLFHYFLTDPMESLTYFVIKFLLAFFIATALFSSAWAVRSAVLRWHHLAIASLIFSTLMSVYYRAWELLEAYAPFGSRAPDIIGISHDNLLLFSGVWWLGHAAFFAIGAIASTEILKK
ncbi:MAG TPA: hypothetical protein VJI75_00330 [Candidatus Nanoarchaeia archaeon]|nr:hypothetical protein [Candidatus Nanoarchaeia archaeon]